MDINKGLIAIGAGLAVMAGMMTGLGEGMAAAHACDAIGKNPEAESKIRSNMILGIALSETVAIYGLLVSILLMFVYSESYYDAHTAFKYTDPVSADEEISVVFRQGIPCGACR